MTRRDLSTVKLALAARKLWENENELRTAEPIAIIGMACRFPGGVDSPDALWEVLLHGKDLVGEVPADRWALDDLFDPDPAMPGKISSRWGGFLDDIRGFDAAFFDISPSEAERMDPQQRISLEMTCESLEHAGLALDELRGSDTGIFFSVYHNDYTLLQYAEPHTISARTLTGTLHSVLANRISYALDLRGPSLVVDSACSSSLVAVHTACQALRMRDCDLAVAGGVNVMIAPHVTIALSKGGFMSPTGRCRAFDAEADGFVRGEACAVIVLKRLSDAIQAGDRVLAVVRGSAVNQDGESTTLSAPNGRAQAALVRRALKNAGVPPEGVSLLEAHGTGTPLGDPIETDALAEVFRGRASDHGPLWLGSLKANVGHPEAAAGVGGIIKTLLCLLHKTIPPHGLFRSLNPHIDFRGTPFRIAERPTAWEPPLGTRIAGVSGFGVGGTNAHVVLEEVPADLESPAPDPAAPPYLLPLSARSGDALRQLASAYAASIREGEDPGVLGRAAARRRSHHREHRAAPTGTTREEILAALDRLADSAAGSPSTTDARRGELCFVFTGQGSQWAGMGMALMEREPLVAEALERLDASFAAAGGIQLLSELRRPAESSRLDRTDVAQAGIFAIQVALTRLLERWGIRPHAVIGHSVGELAAAVAAGLLDEEEAVQAVVDRGRAMQDTYDSGRMLSVRCTADDARDFLRRHGMELAIAAENGPGTIVLSGEAEVVAAAARALVSEGSEVSHLDLRFAFHSPLMAGAASALREARRPIRPRNGPVLFISTVTGKPLNAFDYGYLARNVESPVRFAAAVGHAVRAGMRHFIELGPHPALGGPVTETAAAEGVEPGLTYALHRNRDARATLLSLVGRAYTWGVDPTWERVLPGEPGWPSLPTYPWQHVSYWLRAGTRPAAARPALPTSFPGRRVTSPALHQTVFELALDDAVFSAFDDHRIGGRPRLPATAIAELIRSAGDAAGIAGAVVQNLGFLRPVDLGGSGHIQVVLDRRDPNGAHAEVFQALEEGHWQLAATADLVPPDAGAVARPWVSGGRLSEIEPGEGLHAFLEQRGYDFGPGFRLVERFRSGTEFAEGALNRERAAAWPGRAHPAIVDAAAQLGFAILRSRAAKDGQNGRGTLLPWAIDRYRVRAPTAGASRARAILRTASPQEVVFDVAVTDDAGEELVRIDGLRLRAATAAAAPLLTTRWTPTPVVEARSGCGAWVVLLGRGDLGARVLSALQAAGRRTLAIDPEADDAEVEGALSTLAADGAAWEGVISLRGTDYVRPDETRDPLLDALASCRPLLALARAPGSGAADGLRVLIVTRAAQSVGNPARASVPSDATPLGLLRSLRSEMPELDCTALDLDVAPADGWADDAEALAVVDEALATRVDAEVARREGVRLVAGSAPEAVEVISERSTSPVTLVHTTPGSLEGFELHATSAPNSVPPGHVRVRVLAAGLNFKDVLIALGSISGEVVTGHEACGIVEEVGDGVTGYVPGDRVLVFAPGCFASFAVAPAALVLPAPASMDPVAAATLPVAYGTSWYALRELADVRPGQRVLVHGGAGGVGMACIGLARALGADVYATAGTPARRAFLERLGVAGAYDSRSARFEADVLRATGGEGVDVVVNSLVGPMIPAGLRCLGPGGIFVELGKREILTSNQVTAIRDDVSYRVFDLRDVALSDPTLLGRIFEDLDGRFADGTLAPLPASALPMVEAERAFRRMARSEHVGKIVLLPPPVAPRLDAPGWFIVTGGTGPLGIAAAGWLVDRGARHVTLWARREPGPDVAREIERLRESGAEIRMECVDVADRSAVERTLRSLRHEGVPIRGVIHTAGVVDDATLPNLSWERCEAVLRPKVSGADNLHRATAADPIDLFILYSAAGPVLDGAGQGSYAAANAYMDALAVHRRARGQPAVSLQWGPWAGEGMAARLGEAHAQRWTRRGLEWWTPESARPLLERSIGDAPPVVLAIRLGRVERAEAATAGSGSSGGLGARMAALPADKRRPALVDHVLDCIGRVFGRSEGIDPDVPLRDLGLDSLSAIELRNLLTIDMGSSLPAALAFDHPTPAAIADFLLGQLRLDGEPIPDASRPGPAAAGAERLSEEEAEAFLRQELTALDAVEGRE